MFRSLLRQSLHKPRPFPLLFPHKPNAFSSSTEDSNHKEDKGISPKEAIELMRLVDVEALKKKLGTDGMEEVAYGELLEACEGAGVAKTRDEDVGFVNVLDEAKKIEDKGISPKEAIELMRLVDVEALKKKLGTDGKEEVAYGELLEACEGAGVAKTRDEAVGFVKVLDEAGVVMVFRDKVYLHPDKIVDLVRKAVPLALTPEHDPRREELKTLTAKKDHLDKLAHKQVRCILWTGLGFGIFQVGLFFRLTFWEFSWDVMEPIAFFTTATGIVIGYSYFLYTSRDPTYRDFMKRLYSSRQMKLIKKHNFDFDRYMELQKICSPLDGTHNVFKQ